MQQTLVNSVLIWYDLFTKFLPMGNKIWAAKSGLEGQNLKLFETAHRYCFYIILR